VLGEDNDKPQSCRYGQRAVFSRLFFLMSVCIQRNNTLKQRALANNLGQ